MLKKNNTLDPTQANKQILSSEALKFWVTSAPIMQKYISENVNFQIFRL